MPSELKCIEFACREMHLDSTSFNTPANRIKHDRADHNCHVRRRFRSPEAVARRPSQPDRIQFAGIAASQVAKAVPDVAVGEKVSRVSWVVFELLTELTDENAHIRMIVDEFWTTQGTKQTGMGNGPSCLRHSRREKILPAKRNFRRH